MLQNNSNNNGKRVRKSGYTSSNQLNIGRRLFFGGYFSQEMWIGKNEENKKVFLYIKFYVLFYVHIKMINKMCWSLQQVRKIIFNFHKILAAATIIIIICPNNNMHTKLYNAIWQAKLLLGCVSNKRNKYILYHGMHGWNEFETKL